MIEYNIFKSLRGKNAGLQPVWYIGAIDLPYAEDKNILTAKTWSEVERYMVG